MELGILSSSPRGSRLLPVGMLAISAVMAFFFARIRQAHQLLEVQTLKRSSQSTSKYKFSGKSGLSKFQQNSSDFRTPRVPRPISVPDCIRPSMKY
ncbi:hypothetical protein C8R45DRAFT_1018267 [Mycena sanguinolenta]|nr:hypothetical protein C8R45DRAFT_1018267 [Mycena sanguinolenta]